MVAAINKAHIIKDNYKIENGCKKTFMIITKSAIFVNVFFHE